ncbi:MAG: arsenate reductase ArsC [Rhodocyclaceae bacterium]|nr:arsenate reductase ArsC [Rhodocyclaceae bacterium]
MTERIRNVLFLCTANSARSIIAEAVLTHLSGGRFRAFSAGSHPRGEVHPMALEVLEKAGYPVAGLNSKSWDAFTAEGAPEMDFVFTVCDKAAGASCPVWPGRPVTAHWGFADPAAVGGSHTEQLRAFWQAEREISNRIKQFVNLPVASLDRIALQHTVRDLGTGTS